MAAGRPSPAWTAKERGRSAGFIGGPGAQFTAERRDQRQATARMLTELTARMGGAFDAARFAAEFQRKGQVGFGTSPKSRRNAPPSPP